MKFIHTADWQIGMGAASVAPAAAARVREARFETAARVMTVARSRGAQFVVVAGDLFEDNQVAQSDLHKILRIFEEAAPVPVFVLPGNHDPLGPGSIYDRPAFRAPPSNVVVLRNNDPHVLNDVGAVLLPSPISQKRSTDDPSARIPDHDGSGLVRIGVTHGALRIEGKYQPDDHPIALDAARRQGLDYLAIGHWHSYFSHDPRCHYPGTPEPTAFGEPASGGVCLVTIERPGALPALERVPVATLEWLLWDETLDAAYEASIAQIKRKASADGRWDNRLLRLKTRGCVPFEASAALDELTAWLSARVLHFSPDDAQLSHEIGTGRLQQIVAEHPFLAGLLADLAALKDLTEGRTIESNCIDGSPSSALPAAELQALGKEVGLDDSRAIEEALRLLTNLAAEVWT